MLVDILHLFQNTMLYTLLKFKQGCILLLHSRVRWYSFRYVQLSQRIL